MMNRLLLGVMLGICSTGFSQNLILNPSNDEPLVNGEISGWQEVVGTSWTQRCASPDAYEGSCYFYADAVPLGKLQQTIDLTDYAVAIDNGTQEFYFSGYVVSYLQSPADQSQIELRYFSETNELLEEEIFGPYNNTDAWLLVESNMFAPVGARSFTITLVSIRASGSNNDGYFDALNFVAIEPPVECTLEVNMTQEGDLVTIDANGTGAIVGIYTINWGDESEVENSDSSSHTYEPGEYTLCVTYSDASPPMGGESGIQGCFMEECFDVIIEAPPVECSVQLTLSVSGNAVNATAEGEGLTNEIYSISWGDGSANTNGSSGSHAYLEDGVYEICVTYQDDLIKPTCSATACEDVNIVIIGVDELNANISNLSVHPNPIESDSWIVFSLTQSSNVVIDVLDVLGKRIESITNSSFAQGTHRINWNVQAIESGIYFVRVIADKEQLNFRIIK